MNGLGQVMKISTGNAMGKIFLWKYSINTCYIIGITLAIEQLHGRRLWRRKASYQCVYGTID